MCRTDCERPQGSCRASCPAALMEVASVCHPSPLKGLRSLNDKAVPVLQIPGVEKKQVDDNDVREKVTKVTRDTGKAVAAAGDRPSPNSSS